MYVSGYLGFGPLGPWVPTLQAWGGMRGRLPSGGSGGGGSSSILEGGGYSEGHIGLIIILGCLVLLSTTTPSPPSSSFLQRTRHLVDASSHHSFQSILTRTLGMDYNVSRSFIYRTNEPRFPTEKACPQVLPLGTQAVPTGPIRLWTFELTSCLIMESHRLQYGNSALYALLYNLEMISSSRSTSLIALPVS